MAKMANFKKNDLFLALAIGFASALMLIFVGGNISEENKFFEKLMPYANWLFLIFPLVCGGGIVITHFAAKVAGRALYQFGKFFLVGGFNFLLDAAILNFFLFATKLTAKRKKLRMAASSKKLNPPTRKNFPNW